MALNPDYVLAPSLQMYFVDKDTGLPLTGGEVYFYKDQARTVPKPVYELVSAMPGGPYTYSALPDPVELSAVGTFQDNDGNDILPYYYPYDTSGAIELYYIEVYDSSGVLQFTREAWPNFVVESVTSDQDVTNFVPNGQFLLHNNVPATPANSNTAGKISSTITEVAQGGWTFNVTDPTITTDFITFQRYPYTQSPTGNPRYAVKIQTTIASSGPIKDLRLKYPDVNKFGGTQSYNLYFEGESLTGADINNIQLILIKNYGTGGSTTTEEVISTFSLESNAITTQNITLNFGTNANKTIGALDDDYLQLAIRLPPNTTFTALFTNFCLTINDETVSSFPTQTNAQQLDESTAGWFPTPDHDGFDLYLPAVLTKEGLTFDDSGIGEIIADVNDNDYTGSLHDTSNKMLCDGAQYLTSDYSALGIPYARLQEKLFRTDGKGPLYGTGANFVSARTYEDVLLNNVVRLISNKAGSIASYITVATAVPTNFTVTTIKAGASYSLFAFMNGADAEVYIRNPTIGVAFSAPSAGTSGFTVTDVRDNANVCNLVHIANITDAAALITGIGVAGKYFDFSNISTGYRMWFKINGEIAPAAGGRTLIEVDINTNADIQDVCQIIEEAINGYQMSDIACGNVASFAQNAWFSFNANNGTSYYVWYNKDGAGTDPEPVGFTFGIEVAVTTGGTAANVFAATVSAINSTYFAAPDLRGLFLRGYQGSSAYNFDPNAGNRQTYKFDAYNGNALATLEFDEIYSHNHTPLSNGFVVDAAASGVYGAGGAGGQSATTALTGGTESRPVNVTVLYSIRY